MIFLFLRMGSLNNNTTTSIQINGFLINVSLFLRRNLHELAYVGICSKASENGILICNCLKISRKLTYCFSLSFLVGAWRYGKCYTWGFFVLPFPSLAFWFLVFLSSLTFLSNSSISFSSFFKTNSSSLLFYFISFSLSTFSPSCFYFNSTTTLSISKLSPMPLSITLPLLVVIDLQSSFGLIWVLVVNFPPCWPSNCLAIWPTWVLRFLIDVAVFFWLTIDNYINWFRVSSNFEVLFYWGGFWL